MRHLSLVQTSPPPEHNYHTLAPWLVLLVFSPFFVNVSWEDVPDVLVFAGIFFLVAALSMQILVCAIMVLGEINSLLLKASIEFRSVSDIAGTHFSRTANTSWSSAVDELMVSSYSLRRKC